MSESPCSKCPFRDLLVEYEVGDKHDPFWRMPEVFAACLRVFGSSMKNRGGKNQKRSRKLLDHYCRVQREKYGLCTMKRSRICRGIVTGALDYAAQGETESERYARSTAALRRAVNSEETHALMLSTVVRSTPAAFTPAAFKPVPRDDTWADAA